MGFSALGSNRRSGALGLWQSGISEAILEATRLTYEDANLSSATGSPRAAHCCPLLPTGPAQAEAVRPTLGGRQVK